MESRGEPNDLIEIKIKKNKRGSVLKDITQIIPKKKSRKEGSANASSLMRSSENVKPPTIPNSMSKESTARDSRADSSKVADRYQPPKGPRSSSQNAAITQQQFAFENVAIKAQQMNQAQG